MIYTVDHTRLVKMYIILFKPSDYKYVEIRVFKMGCTRSSELLYLLNDFQFVLNSCKRTNENEQYFYSALGVWKKHENEGENRLLKFNNVWRFSSGEAQCGRDVPFNLSDSVNRIFSDSATLRLMYFGTSPKSLKQKQPL